MTCPDSSNRRRPGTSCERSEDNVTEELKRQASRTLFDDSVGSLDLNDHTPNASFQDIDECSNVSNHLERVRAENLLVEYGPSIQSCSSPQADDVNTSTISDEPLSKKVKNLLECDTLTSDVDAEERSEIYDYDMIEDVDFSMQHYEVPIDIEVSHDSELSNPSVSNACEQLVEGFIPNSMDHSLDQEHSNMDRTFHSDLEGITEFENTMKTSALAFELNLEGAENDIVSTQEESPLKVYPSSNVESDFHSQLSSAADISGDFDYHTAALLGILESGHMAKCSTPLKVSDRDGSVRVPSSHVDDGMDLHLSDSESVANEEESSNEVSAGVAAYQDSDVQDYEDPPHNNGDDIEAIMTSHTKALLLNSVKVHPYSNLSVNESILKIMELHVKNKQSKSGLRRSIETVCSLLPEGHNLPTSSHDVLQYIESLAAPTPATCHYYCESCLAYVGTSIRGLCEVCRVETKFGRFFYFNVAELIKFFFEHRNLASIIDVEASKSGNTSGMKTLRDGSVYQDINRNKSKYDVNFIVSSDGVRIRKGGKELWLAMFTIVEVPIHLQKSFLTVFGVWYDEKKPNMITFLSPFSDSMASLDKGNLSGVEWIHPTTKESHKSCVRLPVTVLDAPARAIMQNTMHFNSIYGCNLCEIEAQLTAPVPDKKRVRRFFYEANPKLRTKARMLNQAKQVGDAEHVKGVKGPSVLSTIPSVDISKCIVPEYLHCVLLGVCKQLLTIWTTKPGLWSLKERISEIDSFMKTFKHPSFIHRLARELLHLKYWKASDFYYFMFFEAVFALQGHLPQVYLQHFYLFVMAIYKLIKTVVTEADINEADMMLNLFVMDFGALYGDRELVSNVHQLLHLALCVRRYGPLHCFSAFMSEDLNGLIAKATHGTRLVEVEIVNNIKMCQGIHILKNIVSGQTIAHDSQDLFARCEFLGKEANVALSPQELNLFREEAPKIFFRSKFGLDEYTSELYKSLQSENFYIMWKEDGCVKYGSIRFFAETSRDKFIVIRLFTVDQTKVVYHNATRKCIEHIIPVVSSENLICLRVSDIFQSIVKVGKIGNFIYLRPNLYRYVM